MTRLLHDMAPAVVGTIVDLWHAWVGLQAGDKFDALVICFWRGGCW
jgi:hypothetical protein